jgi:tetratricopeptide (TPR) repeat protein
LRSFAALTLIAIAVLGANTATSAQTTASQAQKAFTHGVELQQKGDWEGARQAYETALRLAPRRVDVLSNLGLVYSQLGQQERAVKCFHDALRIDPKQYAVRFNLGIAYMRADEYESAQRELSRVVAVQPANYAARHLLGLCLLKLGKVGEGTAELEAVVHGEPENLSAAYTLASAYLKTNELKKVEPLVEKFKHLDSAESHLIVGAYSLALLDKHKALKELLLAQQLNPRLPDLHSQLGYAYFLIGRSDLATQMFEAELEINPQDPNASSNLGSLYRQLGRIDEATVLLTKAIQMRPNDPDILFQLGLLAQSKGQEEKAGRLIEDAIARRPDFPPYHIALVRLYFKLKRLDDMKREQAIVDRLNAERKNLPTVRDKALYDATRPLE